MNLRTVPHLSESFGVPAGLSDHIYVRDNHTKDFVGARRRGWATVRVLTGEHAACEAKDGHAADVDLTSAQEVEKWVKSS